jgi:dTDP-4-dehydrorhamnose 3,5-epimerase-like enzyme
MAQREITDIPGLVLLEPRKFGDHRGFFSEVYNKRNMEKYGFDKEFVQDNQSLSVETGVVRGLHYPERRPSLRTSWCGWCVGGSWTWRSIMRKGSPTYRRPRCGGTERGELAPASGADRFRPRLRNSRTKHRGESTK